MRGLQHQTLSACAAATIGKTPPARSIYFGIPRARNVPPWHRGGWPSRRPRVLVMQACSMIKRPSWSADCDWRCCRAVRRAKTGTCLWNAAGRKYRPREQPARGVRQDPWPTGERFCRGRRDCQLDPCQQAVVAGPEHVLHSELRSSALLVILNPCEIPRFLYRYFLCCEIPGVLC